jgi:hypothetical protein
MCFFTWMMWILAVGFPSELPNQLAAGAVQSVEPQEGSSEATTVEGVGLNDKDRTPKFRIGPLGFLQIRLPNLPPFHHHPEDPTLRAWAWAATTEAQRVGAGGWRSQPPGRRGIEPYQ